MNANRAVLNRLRKPTLQLWAFACALFLTLIIALPARAQTPSPLIVVDPVQARAGSLLFVNGSGFGSGGFDATIFWDEKEIGAFPIDKGGVLSAYIPVPYDATLGAHQVTVCAGNPCFQGQGKMVAATRVEVVELLPRLDGAIAFIYQKDVQTASEFAELLASTGYRVELIPLSDLETTDLTPFSLVIAGPDSGNLATWGTDLQLEIMAKQPHILGLGEGGYALFGRLKLSIGWPNGFHGQSDAIAAADPDLVSFKSPFDLTPPVRNQQTLSLLRAPGNAVTIAAKSITGDVIPHGLYTILGDPTGDAIIVSQGCRTLWGFDAAPSQMSPWGQALFVNMVVWAASSPCTLSQTNLCAAFSDPADVPAPGKINFDDLKDAVVIGQHYANSHGVRFEDNKVTRALTYSDRDTDVGKSRSQPNVAINDAVTPGGSAGVPMAIDFLRPHSQVGLWVGNGKDASGNGQDIPGVLSAYDAAGFFLCSTRIFPVPASHTGFLGLFDARGRIARATIDYGDTSLSESIDDLTFGPFAPRTSIQVCEDASTACVPVAGAEVYQLREGVQVGPPLTTDANGYVSQRSRIDFGDELWVRIPVTKTSDFVLYSTSGAPVPVTPDAFNQSSPGVMRVTVGPRNPLLVFNLDLASQWNMTNEVDYRKRLQDNLIKASNYLYDFTNGQLALGRIDIHQNYDNWSQADIRLYATNNLRPHADPGGIVQGATPDPDVAPLTYYPGFTYMGRTWNRYGMPNLPTDVPVDVTDDWSLALAHELGHYLLFLFDTYLAVTPDGEIVETDSCTGSAMGWVYEPANTEFVFDPVHWKAACGDTVANRLLHRTEWATIMLWYKALIAPTAVNTGPAAPPIPLTSVIFHPPTNPGDPLTNQLFKLDYQDGETASAEARAFLIRNGNRVIDQGQPPEGTTQILLSGAQTGDRFCVYDVNDHVEDVTTPRNQFGCEVLEQGDNTLFMEKDVTWAPVIDTTPVTSRTVAISVTQALTGGQKLRATLYPEDMDTPTEIVLTQVGDQHAGVFHSPVPATGAYVQVYVDEAESETNPRREVMVDYGVGSSGAHGPTSWFDSAPVMSSDGKARYVFSQTVTLAAGEFLALQSTAGTWPIPTDRRIVGQMYKLIALPRSLAKNGVVAIQFQRPLTVTQPTAASAAQVIEPAPVLHYWNGKYWEPLDSFEETGLNGERLIAAHSRGVGFYAVLRPRKAETFKRLYLPLISSPEPQMR